MSRTEPQPRPDVMLNGVIMPASEAVVSVFDRGFTHGDGLFETLLVRAARPLALADHLARLEASAVALGLPVGPVMTWQLDIQRLLLHLFPRGADAPESSLRLQLSAGVPGETPTRLITVTPTGPREQTRRAGLALWTVPWSRAPEGGLGGHKATSWLPGLAAMRLHAHAKDPGFEAVHQSVHGDLLEGATTSLFAVCGSTLVTPPLDGRILAGVTRARVFAAAQALGLTAREAPLTAPRLFAADEVFATNALLPVAPCVSLDGQPLPTGSVVLRVRDRLLNTSDILSEN